MTKKFLGLAVMAIALCVGFSSCSDDDDDVDVDHLVGTWRLVSLQEEWIEDGEKGSDYEDDFDNNVITLRFNEDKSGVFTETGTTWNFTWSLNNNKDRINLSREIYDFENPYIVRLNSSTLILEEKFEYTGGDMYYKKVTFRKN